MAMERVTEQEQHLDCCSGQMVEVRWGDGSVQLLVDDDLIAEGHCLGCVIMYLALAAGWALSEGGKYDE